MFLENKIEREIIMIHYDCVYHSFKKDEIGVISQCERRKKGQCPCDNCTDYFPY